MKSTAWLAGHDLSLTFDRKGRLWQFRSARSARGPQPVASVADGSIEVSVQVPGIQPGDLDVRIRGDVLEIRGKNAVTSHLSWDVGLPVAVELDSIETAYGEDEFGVRLPMTPAVESPAIETPAIEPIPVAV
jgi:HSP20 family molecular chaperone IbpA